MLRLWYDVMEYEGVDAKDLKNAIYEPLDKGKVWFNAPDSETLTSVDDNAPKQLW